MTFADWLISKSKKTPYYHLAGYMERFWLVPYTEAGSEQATGCGAVSIFKRPFARVLQLFGIAVRVHHILSSDDARAFHDHPWPYITVILKGGYFEITPFFDDSGMYTGDYRVLRKAGSILFRKANSWHRLEIVEGLDCWTLFCTGRKKQTWGFLTTPGAKTSYRDFLKSDKP